MMVSTTSQRIVKYSSKPYKKTSNKLASIIFDNGEKKQTQDNSSRKRAKTKEKKLLCTKRRTVQQCPRSNKHPGKRE